MVQAAKEDIGENMEGPFDTHTGTGPALKLFDVSDSK